MNISNKLNLTESKVDIPVDFITSYISSAWSQVGIIKSEIDSIKKEYKNNKFVKVVEECLQDISDSYLIAAGRLQSLLDDGYDISTEKDDEDDSINESITITQPDNKRYSYGTISLSKDKLDEHIISADLSNFTTLDNSLLDEDIDKNTTLADNTDFNNSPFDLICDFPEPELDSNTKSEINTIRKHFSGM